MNGADECEACIAEAGYRRRALALLAPRANQNECVRCGRRAAINSPDLCTTCHRETEENTS